MWLSRIFFVFLRHPFMCITCTLIICKKEFEANLEQELAWKQALLEQKSLRYKCLGV